MMKWTVVIFGKFKDKNLTLPQIVLQDPDWFFWAVGEGVFKGKGALVAEAADIAHKARNIRIPPAHQPNSLVEYVVGPDGKFSHFSIVPADRPDHVGSSTTLRSDHLDLSYPRSFKSYDKLGCRLMLTNFKYYYFGKSNARLTKQRCEDFFSESKNFL